MWAHVLTMCAGDFNEDGHSDLVVANYNSNNVSILRGNGDGTFQAAVNHDVGSYPESVVIDDFNADGHSDLAVANRGSNTVSVLCGNGDGTFQDSSSASVGSYPNSVTAGDFDADGKCDLAVANEGSSSVIILRRERRWHVRTRWEPQRSWPASICDGGRL